MKGHPSSSSVVEQLVQFRTLSDIYTLPIMLICKDLKMEALLNQEFGLIKTALFPKIYDNLGPVVSAKFALTTFHRHYILVLHWGVAQSLDVCRQVSRQEHMHEMMMVCLVDKDDLITTPPEDMHLQYIIQPQNEVVLRNALEPIVYKFLARIFERVASD